jgi:hypothetical protein
LTRQRLNAQDAAEALGISVDAVRMRSRRGTLDSEHENGRLYVWLDTDETSVRSQAEVEAFEEVLEELREQVRYLRESLAEERAARTEERRRHDTLMAQLVQRIPELEAPQERSPDAPRGAAGGTSREEASPAQEGAEPRSATGGVQEGAERPWWRRVFG